jgi:hypothetical protein
MSDSQVEEAMPTHLYHYTSNEVLVEILKSGKMWMTDLRYMNDASELNVLLSALADASNDAAVPVADSNVIVEYNRPDEYRRQYLETLTKLFSGGGFIGALCFSSQHDDLSQWRGYSSKVGQGVCIRFNVAKLLDIANTNNIKKLTRCQYVKDPKLELAQDMRKLIEMIDSGLRSDYASVIAIYDSPRIFAKAAELKHAKFIHENEWRLISPQLGIGWDWHLGSIRNKHADEAVPVHYRKGQHSLVPFTKFPWAEGDGDDGIATAIDGLIVGPTREPVLAKRAIELALRARRMDWWESVEVSQIPYREL